MSIRFSFSLAIIILFVRCNFSHEEGSDPHSIHFTVDGSENVTPAGLIFDGAKHHLFYQFNSGNSKDDFLHWGHAISDDLIHWQKLPVTVFRDSLKSAHFGNIVIDGDNTSGFGKNGISAMIAFFTFNGS